METYKITNVGANKCLNIHGSNITSLRNNQNVTLWDDSETTEQKWVINSLGTGVFVCSAVDTAFGLNVYRVGSPYNCDVHKVSGNETDAAVVFIEMENCYKVKLTNYDLYLTADGSENGANVYWGDLSDSDFQCWECSVVPQISEEPDEDVDDDALGQPVNSTADYDTLTEVDIIARCIYSEAGNQGDTGQRAVACVLRNRKQNWWSFSDTDTYRGVILMPSQFSGMTTSYALRPDTDGAEWKNCVNIAKNIETISNPIGNCKWFRTISSYNKILYAQNPDIIYFGGRYQTVTEKYTIVDQVFYNLQGF